MTSPSRQSSKRRRYSSSSVPSSSPGASWSEQGNETTLALQKTDNLTVDVAEHLLPGTFLPMHADTILGKVINMSNLTQEEKPSAFAFTALVSNADGYSVIIFLSWLKSSILQIRAIIFNRSFSYLKELWTSIDPVYNRGVSLRVVCRVLLLLHPADSPALRSICSVSFKR